MMKLTTSLIPFPALYLLAALVMVTASLIKLTAQVSDTTKTTETSAGAKVLDYSTRLEVLSEGHDGRTEWGWPRVGLIPPKTAVVLMHRSSLAGSDTVLSTHDLRTDDLGATWTKPQLQPNLGRRPFDGNPNVDFSPIDLVPAWHAASGRLLALGHVCAYRRKGTTGAYALTSLPNFATYSAYDQAKSVWSDVSYLDLPDKDHFFCPIGGAAQRVDLPNGDILWPIYFMDRAARIAYPKSRYSATIVRCRFDGQTMKYVEHGDELAIPDPRGFCEPSLTQFGGRFFLMLRNDRRAYVSVGDDGLHFQKPVPWTFDDGKPLGSANTQQHWVTHSDSLFLVYTRGGANNDHVILNRAPLFMAQVDPQRLCVIRATERILLPDKGAQYGQFGALNASAEETWVMDAESMLGDAKKPFDIARTIQRGASNRVYLCRII